jgi:hypothetical protein
LLAQKKLPIEKKVAYIYSVTVQKIPVEQARTDAPQRASFCNTLIDSLASQ